MSKAFKVRLAKKFQHMIWDNYAHKEQVEDHLDTTNVMGGMVGGISFQMDDRGSNPLAHEAAGALETH